MSHIHSVREAGQRRVDVQVSSHCLGVDLQSGKGHPSRLWADNHLRSPGAAAWAAVGGQPTQPPPGLGMVMAPPLLSVRTNGAKATREMEKITQK